MNTAQMIARDQVMQAESYFSGWTPDHTGFSIVLAAIILAAILSVRRK